MDAKRIAELRQLARDESVIDCFAAMPECLDEIEAQAKFIAAKCSGCTYSTEHAMLMEARAERDRLRKALAELKIHATDNDDIGNLRLARMRGIIDLALK